MFLYRMADNINPEENINLFKYLAKESDMLHIHEFIEMVYILSGSGEHAINGTNYSVERGDLLFINYNQTHSFKSNDGMVIVNCLMKPEFISQELVNSENANEILSLASFEDFSSDALKLVPKVCFRGKQLIEIEALIEGMLTEFIEKAPGYKTVLKGYMSVILIMIFRQIRSTDAGSIVNHLGKVTPMILQYIEEKCFKKITLGDLAEKCFYNPSYLSRVFKECYGKSIMDYIHEKRVQEAVRLLMETDLSIEDVCYKVGYKEKKQFYKIFKKYTGGTPNNMRVALPPCVKP